MSDRKSTLEVAADITIAKLQTGQLPLGDAKFVADYFSVVYSQLRKLENMTAEELEAEFLKK